MKIRLVEDAKILLNTALPKYGHVTSPRAALPLCLCVFVSLWWLTYVTVFAKVFYSCFKATIGSTFVARLAGMYIAVKVTRHKTTEAAPSVNGSMGPTLNSID
jgi:hypothetical protein